MKKLTLQMQMSADGFVAGPNGEMDWMAWNWDDQLKNYVKELTDPVDCILMGRNLAAGFIPHWEGVARDPANPEYEAGKKFSETPKFVFSKTLDVSNPLFAASKNAKLVNGDLVKEVNNLKQQPGKSMMAYGGAGFVASLIQHNLIDEYHLFINPTAIGKGMSIFGKLDEKLRLQLKRSQAFDCGVVVLVYQPVTE